MEANFKNHKIFGKKPALEAQVYSNFLPQDVHKTLRQQVLGIKLKRKDNDLYKFKQSKDIKSELPANDVPALAHEFIDLMVEEVRLHLQKAYKLELSDTKFDITVSSYTKGDYLLCHNDHISDVSGVYERAIAFVYYLNSRPFHVDDGGSLVIFNPDPEGEPTEVHDRLFPVPNTMVVFRTSSISWHAVDEVLCSNDNRLSINGWFYSKKDPLPSTSQESTPESSDEKIVEPCPYTFFRPGAFEERIHKFFHDFVDGRYMVERTCHSIRKKFRRKSEINLVNFMKRDKYKEISEALRIAANDPNNSEHMGPYNKRNVKILKREKLPQICKDLYDAFSSEFFFILLASYTGLDLKPQGAPSTGKSDTESTDSRTEIATSEEGELDEGLVEGHDEPEPIPGPDEPGPSGTPVAIPSDDEEEEGEPEDDEEDDDEGDEGDEGDEEEEEAEEDEESDPDFTPDDYDEDEPVIPYPTIKGQSSQELAPELKTGGQDDSLKRVDTSDSGPKEKKKKTRKSNPFGRAHFRQLDPGSYTLIHDHQYELSEKSALDVIFHFNHDFDVDFSYGGYTCYIDTGPDEDPHNMNNELLTVEPVSNCLSLVYRCDEGTCRFLKRISHFHEGNYQDLHCVYYEKPDDLYDYQNLRFQNN